MQNVTFKQSNDGDTRLAAGRSLVCNQPALLLGTGPAVMAVYYMSLYPNQAMATHNNYIDILAETGVIGTCFYVWLLGSLVMAGLSRQ